MRTAYADGGNKGRYAQKDLGLVYSRDILGEPGSLNTTAPRLLQDTEPPVQMLGERDREERTLEELKFQAGDFLLVAVLLPKNVTGPSELAIKGSGSAAAPSAPGGWKTGGPTGAKGDAGWGSRGAGAGASGPPVGRGGGHWRGESNAPAGSGRGRGGRGGDFGRDRDGDSRVPPPRRNDSPPPRGGWGSRGGRGGDRRSRSRSKSPPRRRRYD